MGLAVKEDSVERDICEYNGVEYPIMIEMDSKKRFIQVDEHTKLYIDKHGCVAARQPGGQNVKDCIDSYEDLHRIYNYLMEKKKWNIYLLFVCNYNLSRRIGDLLSVRWCDLFDPDWKNKEKWELREGKTNKKNEIKINRAVKIAFKIFFENETAFEKNEKTYKDEVFIQLHGSYKGKVISDESNFNARYQRSRKKR